MSISREQIQKQITQKAIEDSDFRAKLINDPKAVINEYLPDNVEIPDSIAINVVEEKPTELTLVLPPSGDQEELSADELDSVAAGGGYGGGVDIGPLHFGFDGKVG